jgi:catechol 2,3-dioxygenase-like lactoylglutathione lyase family enzyme
VADLLTLGSPTHTVIGAVDLDASIEWWTGLGFGVATENTLDPMQPTHCLVWLAR